MGDLKDRPALGAAQLKQQVVELFGGLAVETGLGLVEHEKPPGPYQAEGQQNPFGLAAGEIADQAIGQVGGMGLAQGMGHGASAPLASRPGQSQARWIPAQANKIAHGEGATVPHRERLGHVGHLLADGAGQLALGPHGVAEHPDRTGRGGKDPQEGLDQGALTGAVGPHQGRVGFRFQGKTHVVHGDDGITPHGQPADIENHFHHGCSLPSA